MKTVWIVDLDKDGQSSQVGCPDRETAIAYVQDQLAGKGELEIMRYENFATVRARDWWDCYAEISAIPFIGE